MQEQAINAGSGIASSCTERFCAVKRRHTRGTVRSVFILRCTRELSSIGSRSGHGGCPIGRRSTSNRGDEHT